MSKAEDKFLIEMRKLVHEALSDFKTSILAELDTRFREINTNSKDMYAYLTTEEVCRRWGRSRTTLSQLIKQKKLSPSGKYGRSYVFRQEDIIQLFGYCKFD
jgi:excisionase family DNA binding protein